MEWSGSDTWYQRVLALYAVLTGVIPKGLILWTFCRKFFNIFGEEMGFLLWLLFGSWESLVGRWCVRCAAIWHWCLLLCIYIVFFFLNVAFVHSFFILFKNLVLMGRWGGPWCWRVLAFCAFLAGAVLRGLVLWGFCVWCSCIFCFMWVCVRTDFVVFG